jgi:anti-sigma regulatory factor (Ser/Thr protein kinase)
MQYLGDASAPQKGFVHSALIYGSDDAFMDVALPFVEDGMAHEEPTLVAVQGSNVENLREALGGEPDGVTLLSVEEWYESSARTRDKFARWAEERTGAGRVRLIGEATRARLIGEPPWAVGNEAQIRDWARHESVINVAFEGMPVSFMCPYDARVLPAEIVEYAHHTHPVIEGADGASPSEDYEDPWDFCRGLDSDVSKPTGQPAARLDFNLADLRRIRRLVTSMAMASGLSGSRADELALAVNEIASNAVVHGQPPATLRIWQEPGELVCEVSDDGDGIKDAMAGQLTPPAGAIGGRGIWLTRMLCDAVEIRKGDGCTVALHASTPELAFAS